MFRKIQALKWRARRLPELFRTMLTRENYEWVRSYESFGDVYEVNHESFADWLGVKWPGRPFTLYPLWHYDLYDYVFDVLDAIWYVMSGEADADECRAADEAMLANAY